MCPRLIKKSLSGLPRTNQRKPRSRLHRFGSSLTVQAFFVIIFASLGLSLIIYLGHLRFWRSRPSTAVSSVLSRFTSKPPLVDRAILEKIAGLDPEDEESGPDFSIPINTSSPYVFSPFLRPPKVTCIPEVQPQAPSNLEMETRNQFCSKGNADNGPSSCKFLLPLKIAEQSLNAHVHLVQLLKLARALNRTLILPNVGKNGVGACRRWRFSVYYDERALLSGPDGDNSSSVIQQDRFKAWVDSLRYSPSSQLVSVDWTHPKKLLQFSAGVQSNDGLDFYIHHNSETAAMFYTFAECLNRKFPQLDLTGPFPPLSFVVSDHGKQERSGGDISRVLLEKLSALALAHTQSEPLRTISNHSADYDFNRVQMSPDVLIVSWNIPLSTFQPHQTTTIHYSPQLRALAARLVRHLGSYVAVTWNVETSKGDAVLGCIEALRSALHHVLSSHKQLGIRNIWLAGNLSPSDLLHPSEPLCASTLAGETFFVPDVKLTGVRQELERMIREGEEIDDVASNGDQVVRKQEVMKDAGVLGILDKLVSMRSTVFVTASKGCGKTRCDCLLRSSFTKA
jgi:hypothetical protein